MPVSRLSETFSGKRTLRSGLTIVRLRTRPYGSGNFPELLRVKAKHGAIEQNEIVHASDRQRLRDMVDAGQFSVGGRTSGTS